MKLYWKIVLLLIIIICLGGCKRREAFIDNNDKYDLTIYTSHSSNMINNIIREFSDKYKAKVHVYRDSTKEIMYKLNEERIHERCDVVWGGGADSYTDINDLLYKYVPNNYKPLGVMDYNDNDNFLPESPLPLVIVYNKKLVPKKMAPKEFKDLINPFYKGKIGFANPLKSGAAYTILGTLLMSEGGNNDKGWSFIKSFINNLDGRESQRSSMVYNELLDGSIAAALVFEDKALQLMDTNSDFRMVYPNNGTTLVPECVGILKTSNNRALAEEFVSFLFSKDCEEIRALGSYRRPTHTEIKFDTRVKPLNSIKRIDYNIDYISKNRQEIIDKWSSLIN